jgi:protein TonB
VFVVGFHVAGAAALLARWNDDSDVIASAPVIMIDLAPVAVAPQTATDLPPGPQQSEAQPEPEPEPPPPPPIEKIPDPIPEPQVAVTPPPLPPEPPKEPPEEKPPEKPPEKEKPKEKKKIVRDKRARLASAPSPADHKAERAAAPMPGAGARNSNAVPSWKSALVAQLERNKRYPSEAQSRGEHGVAQLAFTVDRHGGVHNARIMRSSGSSALDRETLAMIARAQPLPPPPPEVPGAHIPIVVPIRYNVR